MLIEPNDLIAEATDTQVTDESPTGVFNGEIETPSDVDFYRFELGEGDGIKLNTNTQGLDSELNSYLRLFDAQGNELTFNDDNDANFTGEFSPDSSLAFVPNAPGIYYVGVGTSGNSDYDPVNGRTNFSAEVINPFATTGSYQLGLDVVEVLADADPDNTISEAIESNASSSETRNVSIDGAIYPSSDADIYRFELEQGDGVTVSVNTFSINSELDSYLRLFDANGNELLSDDDDENNIEDSLGTDSLLNFAPDSSGVYYIGVSSDGNTAYNSVQGSNNFTPNSALGEGDYNLEIDIAQVVPDSDPDNTIAESIVTEVGVSVEQTTISEEIDAIADVDLYQLELEQGNKVSFDLDTVDPDNRLDTVLQVFDANGKQLAFNDDDSAADENSNLDSYLEFTALTTGKYYVGVSSYGNFDYDPLKGSNNFSHSVDSTTGNYDLVISLADSANILEGTGTADRLVGTQQPDLIEGFGGNDSISGAAQGDTLVGDRGNDSLQGNGGDDLLLGGKGVDELLGGGGNDTLDGNEGDDLLYGNGGADIFIIGNNNADNSGEDTIADFEAGIDKIKLFNGINFTDLTLVFNPTLSSTSISFENEILVNLAAIAPEQLTDSDFIS